MLPPALVHLPAFIAPRLLPLVLLAAAYCTLLVRTLPPGAPKLLLSLPVLLLFFLAPLGFDAVSVAGNIGFVLSWLANFKLLAASGGRGPLALHGISAAQYAALLLFPFYNAKPGALSCCAHTRGAPHAHMKQGTRATGLPHTPCKAASTAPPVHNELHVCM